MRGSIVPEQRTNRDRAHDRNPLSPTSAERLSSRLGPL